MLPEPPISVGLLDDVPGCEYEVVGWCWGYKLDVVKLALPNPRRIPMEMVVVFQETRVVEGKWNAFHTEMDSCLRSPSSAGILSVSLEHHVQDQDIILWKALEEVE
ncbi:uncharacterized protein ARMOST_12179 [Armillaria ostoyae]|uniref:Uncharacterized protein n=1 Tax=Armillaria ostoyae TaxID=47428 RepID=A0A284RJ70_ARMOS|nr:uncharacterized protein ARMOST_12179 [Armillaria ostoyae]